MKSEQAVDLRARKGIAGIMRDAGGVATTVKKCLARRLGLAAVAVVAAGCAGSLPVSDAPVTPSSAFTDWQQTTAGRAVAGVLASHPDQSGFALLAGGEEAFTARRGLTLLAERSIDVQYYIWEGDTTGRLLAQDLVAAADRGVRVRVLIDDIHTKGKDFNIAALDAHPNVEVRVFNPFSKRDARNLNLVTEFQRLNHRMHNKLWLVDGAAAIVGGRNIGDDYFGINTVTNFRDLDMVAVGPVVPEVGKSFDLYWNSDWALPIAAMAEEVPSAEAAAGMRRGLADWAAGQREFPYRVITTREEALAVLEPRLQDLLWGNARVFYDPPEKMAGALDNGVDDALLPEVRGAQRELLMEVAYFIATDEGTDLLTQMAARGVRVRILTNSLATNDLVPAHAGYTRYRERLVRGGVELHEFRPDASGPRSGWSSLAGRSRASLHTKAIVIDGRRAFVGSFNLTPRSAQLNTEIGIMVDSAELAAAVAAFMNAGVESANAWRLQLEDDEVMWTGQTAGVPVAVDHEPDVGWWRRFTTWLIAVLPVEKPL